MKFASNYLHPKQKRIIISPKKAIKHAKVRLLLLKHMRMTMANQPPQPQQAGMPNMKVIQQIFPFMMLFFFNRYASGLSLYYFAANVISLGQMVAIKAWFIDEPDGQDK